MSEKNIPAFPGKATINRSNGELQPHQFGNDDFETLGMTLRDYFAAKAMQGMCANGDATHRGDDVIAKEAYGIADAMLKAREAC